MLWSRLATGWRFYGATRRATSPPSPKGAACASPPGAPEGEPGLIESVRLQASDDGVYVGLYEYWPTDAEYLIAGHVERIGEDGWIRAVEGGTQALGRRAQAGVIAISADDAVYAFDADGTGAWVVETELSLRFSAVLADDSVLVVASDRVVAFGRCERR